MPEADRMIMHSVPRAVHNEISAAVKRVNQSARVVLVCRKSNHPDDSYMYCVAVYVPQRRSYTTWCYNTSTHSLCYGHYELNYGQALECIHDYLYMV